MDATGTLLVGLAGGFATTGFGVILGRYLDRRSIREDREWQERQTLRQRQEEAARVLNDVVVDVEKACPFPITDRKKARSELNAAMALLVEGMARAGAIADEDILDRLWALETAMSLAQGDGRALQDWSDTDLWPLTIAFRDLRRALAAFQRREAPPAREFPDREDLIRLSRDENGRRGLRGVREHLIERGVWG